MKYTNNIKCLVSKGDWTKYFTAGRYYRIKQQTQEFVELINDNKLPQTVSIKGLTLCFDEENIKQTYYEIY